MPARAFPLILIVGVMLLLAATSLFTVRQSQLAIRTEFGAIAGTYAPGLHVKWPWDQVVKLDRRLLSESYTGETFLTHDNRSIIVDLYVKWRIQDPTAYFRETGGREDLAGARLAEIVKDGIKTAVAERTLQQIVASERRAVTTEMFGPASQRVAELGIQLIDVRIQRIDLPDDVASRVYESMKESFGKIAGQLRAQGQSQAATIRAAADRQRMEILANAQSDALKVKGAADAQAALIYAKAYSKNPEFYAFYRSMQAYQKSLGKDGDLLVITPDGAFFKYLKDPDKHTAGK